jgi:hypothetical protein
MKPRRTAQEQKLADDQRLLRAWKKFHREEREAALAGPHGAVLGELFRMFENLKFVQPVQLIGLMRSVDWTAISHDVRLTVLHELNTAITKVREARGLDPIDDGVPCEPETPYRTIKAIMFPTSLPCEGAHRGEARPE